MRVLRDSITARQECVVQILVYVVIESGMSECHIEFIVDIPTPTVIVHTAKTNVLAICKVGLHVEHLVSIFHHLHALLHQLVEHVFILHILVARLVPLLGGYQFHLHSSCQCSAQSIFYFPDAVVVGLKQDQFMLAVFYYFQQLVGQFLVFLSYFQL